MAYSKTQIEDSFSKICKKISDEGFSLRKCLREKGTPDAVTFYKWIEKDADLLKRYAHATNRRAEAIFEEILTICDATEDDLIFNEDGYPITNHNVIQRDRLRVDSRKWMLGKMNPKKYSDKIQVDTTEFKEQPLFDAIPKDDSNR